MPQSQASAHTVESTILPLPTEAVHGLGLVVEHGTARIFVSDSPATSEFPGQAFRVQEIGGTFVSTTGQLLPATPSWDIGIDTEGRLRVVVSTTGGATSHLDLVHADGTGERYFPAGAWPSATAPRFAKGWPADVRAPVVAVVNDETLVRIREDEHGTAIATDPLAPAEDGVVVRDDYGEWLWVRTRTAGAVRGDAWPGIVSVTRLGPDGSPGAWQHPWGEQPVHGFDVVSGGELHHVVGVLDHGLELLIRDARTPEAGFHPLPLTKPLDVKHPSTARLGLASAGLVVAALERDAQGKPRLWTATISPP